MEILNKKERISAFMLFMLMFVITTGTLLAAIFVNYRLPLKENEVLKAENEKILNEFTFQKTFSDRIEHVAKLVDSLDKAPESFQFTEQTINHELVGLRDKLPTGSDQSLKLYENYILNITSLVNTKKQLLQVADSKKEIDALKEQIKAYDEDNKELTRELNITRQLNMRPN